MGSRPRADKSSTLGLLKKTCSIDKYYPLLKVLIFKKEKSRVLRVNRTVELSCHYAVTSLGVFIDSK